MKKLLLVAATAIALQGCGGEDYTQHYVAVCPGLPDLSYSREVTYDALGGEHYGLGTIADGSELIRLPENCIVTRAKK